MQGVGYRWFAEHVANELGLAGYVKNLYDGSVEVYAVGPDDKLDELRSRLQAGPRGARVLNVNESPAPVRAGKEFRIEY